VKSTIAVGVGITDSVDRLPFYPNVPSIVAKRDGCHVLGRKFRPQLEILAHTWLKLVQQMSTSRYRITFGKLARHGRSADLLVGFENQHLLAGPGQERRANQAVVASPYNYRIVFISHRRNSLERCLDV